MMTPINRAFLHGDFVNAYFFVNGRRLVMAEECYFYLMASMRKMRMNIPLSYTLEFFETLLNRHIESEDREEGIIRLMVYRENDTENLDRARVAYYLETVSRTNVFILQDSIAVDVIKEILVGKHFLSAVRTASPENIYAGIYAKDNDLGDVIFLNSDKRIARGSVGNYIFLMGNTLKIPKTSEGAYVSPLLENFVTFIHKRNLATIEECEMIAFETQKAEEILLISDEKGIFSVNKIRSKEFTDIRFQNWLAEWRTTFDLN